MPTVDIVINATGKESGSPSVAREFTYEDLIAAPLVTLSLNDSTGVTSYSWQILDKPPGSSAILSSSTVASPTFSPDLTGTYLIKCTVNSGEAYNTSGIAYTTRQRAFRKPAIGETKEFDSNGWVLNLNEFIDIVDSMGTKEYIGGLNHSATSGVESVIGATEFDPTLHPSDAVFQLEMICTITDDDLLSVGKLNLYDYGPIDGPPITPVLVKTLQIDSQEYSGLMKRVKIQLYPVSEIYNSGRIYQFRSFLSSSSGSESLEIHKAWISVK